MCRNIKTLFNFEPPATKAEIRDASLQFVRKLSGFNRPSKANEQAFDRAVDAVAEAARQLIDSLTTTAPARDRAVEAEKARDSVEYLYRNLATLGDKRGPVLYQLPPFLKKDLARLTDFLAVLPSGHQAAFEFRNDTWFDDAVYAALKAGGASLCHSEREDNEPPPLVETAPWGYVRLRLETYSDQDLERWARRLDETGWRQIYVYFMHEPTAPAYARTLMGFVG